MFKSNIKLTGIDGCSKRLEVTEIPFSWIYLYFTNECRRMGIFVTNECTILVYRNAQSKDKWPCKARNSVLCLKVGPFSTTFSLMKYHSCFFMVGVVLATWSKKCKFTTEDIQFDRILQTLSCRLDSRI